MISNLIFLFTYLFWTFLKKKNKKKMKERKTILNMKEEMPREELKLSIF